MRRSHSPTTLRPTHTPPSTPTPLKERNHSQPEHTTKPGNHTDSSATTVHFDRTVTEATLDLKAASDSGYSNTDNITNETFVEFTLAGLEYSADPTTGTGKASITIYDWEDTNSNNIIDETGDTLTSLHSITNVSGTTQDTASGDITLVLRSGDHFESIYKLAVKQTDDAGNVSWTPVNKLAYDATTGTKGDNVVILDQINPRPPGKPDLSPVWDSYGANTNPSRDGTDADDVTKYPGLLFFTDATDEVNAVDTDSIFFVLTNAALIREQHHLLAYELSTADSSTATATAISGTALSETNPQGTAISSAARANPADTANRTIASHTNTPLATGGTGTRTGQRHTHRFPGATDETEGEYHIAVKQVDAAGNVSNYSEVLSVKIDRKKPNEVPGELVLHRDSDTGTSQTDRRTANTTPVFTSEFPRTRQLEGENTDTDFQVDYYELWRVLLDENFETVGSFTYPSRQTHNDQASFDFVPDTDGETTKLADASSSNPLLDVYTNGISVRILRQDIPEFNKHYSYKMVAVDLAGNHTLGVDEANPEILVPPPVPSDPDLATASDTGNSNSDNLTKNTTITLSTSYKNTSTDEQKGQAAQNLRDLVLTITPPTGDPITHTYSRPADHTSGDGFVIPSGETRDGSGNLDTSVQNFTATYTFSKEVDLTTLFTDLQDGAYQFSFHGVNGDGEQGNPSAVLTVTVDTTAPALGDDLTLTSDRQYTLSGGATTPIHHFNLTAAAIEEGTVVTIHYGVSGATALTVSSGTATAILNTVTSSVDEDYSDYEVSLVDKAGNAVPRFAYPDTAKAPRIFSFNAGAADTYIITASPRNDSTITEPYTATAYSSSSCALTGSTNRTPRSKVTIPASDSNLCTVATDSYGNRAALHSRSEATALITGAGIHPDDDSGEQGDGITNNPNPRYRGTTVPGTRVRFQGKEPSDDWASAHEETVTADADGAFTVPRVLSTPATGGDGTIFTTQVTAGNVKGAAFSGGDLFGFSSQTGRHLGAILTQPSGSVNPVSFTHNGATFELLMLFFTNKPSTTTLHEKIAIGFKKNGNTIGHLSNTFLPEFSGYGMRFTDGVRTVTVPITAGNTGVFGSPGVFGGDGGQCVESCGNTITANSAQTALLRQHFFTEGTTFTFSIVGMPSLAKTLVDMRGYLTNSDILGAAELSSPVDLTQITLDITPPDVSAALKTPPTSPNTNTTPTITITAEDGATVGLYTDVGCTTQTGSSVTISGSATGDITTGVLAEGEHEFYAKAEDVAGNSACTTEALTYTLDTTAPTVSVVKIGSGASASYVATAVDATATTARYKDNTASGSCATSTDTTGGSWADYTGQQVTAHDTAGLCIIFADAAGNKTKQHILDSGTFTTGMGALQISDDTGFSSTDFITNNPVQSLSAITVPGSEGTITLTDKADATRTIVFPFTAAHYSTDAPSRFTTAPQTIPEGTYTITGSVTIAGAQAPTAVSFTEEITIDTTPIARPDFSGTSYLSVVYRADNTNSNPRRRLIRAGVHIFSYSINFDSDDLTGTTHTLTLFGTEYPVDMVNSALTLGVIDFRINYTITEDTPQGPMELLFEGEDKAGNRYSHTIRDSDSDNVFIVDTTAPEYTITASKQVAKPGDTVTITVDAEDTNGVLLENGSAVSEDNQIRISFAGETFSLNSLPGSFSYTVPDTATDGFRSASLPNLTDPVGNETGIVNAPLFFIDTKKPTIPDYVFSVVGTNISFAITVDRNNHAAMTGDEGISFSFDGSCSRFPSSPVFTDAAKCRQQTIHFHHRCTKRYLRC